LLLLQAVQQGFMRKMMVLLQTNYTLAMSCWKVVGNSKPESVVRDFSNRWWIFWFRVPI